MADNTKIEWADATLNYANGCDVLSPGCTNCYAMKLAGTRLKHHPSRAGLTLDTKAGPVWTGEVRLQEPALMQALRWKRGRKIFWNAHGDLFHENVPDEAIDRLFAVCALTPQHTHMILTKRSARMREYLSTPFDRTGIMIAAANITQKTQNFIDFPMFPLPNVWLGVSVEDQQRADERVPDLLNTPAAVRFISAEPLLGSINLGRICLVPKVQGSPRAGIHIDALQAHYVESGLPYVGAWDINKPMPRSLPALALDFVIVGGESGPGARPMHPDWARSLRDQCISAGVAFHFKQWGEWFPVEDGAFSHWLSIDGKLAAAQQALPAPDDQAISRVGKKCAGRLLDGREWNEVPYA